jgi:hypothetical protein
MVVSPQLSWMPWPAITHASRRWQDDSQRHRRPQVSQHGVGDPVTTGGHHRCGRGGWLPLVAGPRAHARHARPALPVTASARPPRVPPWAASVGLTVQRVGLRSSPHDTPPHPVRTPLATSLRRHATPRIRGRAVARPSSLCWRGGRRLHARDPGATGRVRPADRAAPRGRLSRRPAAGALPCRPRAPDEARGGALMHP